MLLPVLAVGEHLVERREHLGLRVHRQAERGEVLERRGVRGERRCALDLAELVRPERQVAVRRDRRVLLAQAAGRGVARVDERPRAGGLGRHVEALEAGDRHVHLAADLEHVGHSALHRGELARHRRDRRHVGGDVLADPPVAACGGLLVAATFVADAHRQPVDLELADVGDGLAGESLGDPGTPRLELLASHRVVEAHHRDGVRRPARTTSSARRRRRCPADCRTRRRGAARPARAAHARARRSRRRRSPGRRARGSAGCGT